MASDGLTGRVATAADYDKLEPLFRANCQKMQYEWPKYEFAAKHILAHPEYGFVIMAEQADGSAAGFISLTFEWSDWRNGVFLWMQGLQADANCDEATVIGTLKAALEVKRSTLDWQVVGIRLCSPKVLQGEVQQAITAFDLKPSHYYVYHVDTA